MQVKKKKKVEVETFKAPSKNISRWNFFYIIKCYNQKTFIYFMAILCDRPNLY